MSLLPPIGGPGVGTTRTVSYRRVFENNGIYLTLPGGAYINGTKSRDSGNTGDTDTLRCGLLMGKITATGLYAPTILGVASAYTSGATSLTVTAAQAAEIVRRIGSSGTLKAVGPPTANGTVATTSVTYSAVNTTTGVLTVTDLGVDKVAGTFITDTDGTVTPITFIPDGSGMPVTDQDGVSVASVQWHDLPIGGNVLAQQLLYWPTDTSLQAWIIASLNAAAGGQFNFVDYRYRLLA